MRKNIRNFVELSAATLPLSEPIFEFGAYQVEGQKALADIRPIFGGREFVGCDMRSGPGVDRVLDLHDIAVEDGTVGTILCMDTLEHVEYPHRAVAEIHRVLRPGGLAIISSVMDFPIHNHPYDYWRFSPEGLESLLKPFQSRFVGSAGDPAFPHTVVGLGFKGDSPDMERFLAAFKDWQNSQGKTFDDFLHATIPPFLLPRLRSAWRFIRGRPG